MKAAAIVSAYFCDQYLEGRLENLLTQTERPRIVVVCQQGSKERDIAAKMLTHYDVLLSTDKLVTIYHAWNLGIRAANTGYVTNANADDRLAPNGIEALTRALDEHPDVGMVYPDVDIVREIGGPVVGGFRFAEGGFPELMQMCFVGPMPMWRRSLHEKHGWFDADMQSAGDYEFWLRLAKAGEKLLHVRQVLGIYLDRPDSAGHRDMRLVAHETDVARKRYGEPRSTRYGKVVAKWQ